MTDFQKALGILGKAMQVSMFEPKAFGRTKSGKPIRERFDSVLSFMRHHKDWTKQDHHDAMNLHFEHQKKQLGGRERGDSHATRMKAPKEFAFHNHMANAHMSMQTSKVVSSEELSQHHRVQALMSIESASKAR